MLSDRQSSDEQIVLLHVRRDGGQQGTVDRHAVDRPHAGHGYVLVASESQRVQKGRFAGSAGSHQGQKLAGSRRTAHCKKKKKKFE